VLAQSLVLSRGFEASHEVNLAAPAQRVLCPSEVAVLAWSVKARLRLRFYFCTPAPLVPVHVLA